MSGVQASEVLRVSALSHRYTATAAVREVNLTVRAGECVALLGPNGAGKTTLVNLVNGLLRRQHGEIELAGGDPRMPATRRHLGVVQQSLGFPSTLKVGELVTGAAVRGGAPKSAAGPVLAELGLTDLIGRRAVKLSGGQRQRVQLAMAIVTEPDLLVLDEPTVGLDVPARRRFWEIVRRRRDAGAGVLLTTHLLEEPAAVADRVAVLDHGRLLADEPPAVLTARIPDRTVTVRTRLSGQDLESMPGAVSVGHDGEHVRIGTREPERLLRVLLQRDPQLSDLRVEGAGLEEAVVGLTEQPRTPMHPATDMELT